LLDLPSSFEQAFAEQLSLQIGKLADKTATFARTLMPAILIRQSSLMLN
jgi:hypothetical protein